MDQNENLAKKLEEILTLLDELSLQQHLNAMAWEEGEEEQGAFCRSVASAVVVQRPPE